MSLDNPLIQGSTKLFSQVDIVDFNGSFLTRVRDLIGANPIILVATKVSILSFYMEILYIGILYHQRRNKESLRNLMSVVTNCEGGPSSQRN